MRYRHQCFLRAEANENNPRSLGIMLSMFFQCQNRIFRYKIDFNSKRICPSDLGVGLNRFSANKYKRYQLMNGMQNHKSGFSLVKTPFFSIKTTISKTICPSDLPLGSCDSALNTTYLDLRGGWGRYLMFGSESKTRHAFVFYHHQMIWFSRIWSCWRFKNFHVITWGRN